MNLREQYRFRAAKFNAFALLALGLWCSAAALAGDVAEAPTVLSLARATDGERVVFVVDIQRPADMTTMTIERGVWWRGSASWPRNAELRSDPAWNCPCYLAYARGNAWEPVRPSERLTFVGRCLPADTLKLTLRYPAADRQWRETPLALDLVHATALPADPSPRKRFAEAQAEWFESMGRQTEDFGGFFAYAAQQTRRQYELAATSQPVQRWGPVRNAEEEFYNITTGALAVQESLQLDRMTNVDRDRGWRELPIKDIPGVAVKSHPFDEMRGGREPIDSGLARLLPEDFYYLRFESIAKLLEFLDLSDQWGTSLLRIASPVGTDFGVRERMHRQLCLPQTVLARVLGPAVISELAAVGSDPYVQEGSDFTVLFNVRHKGVFQTAVDVYFQQARQASPDAIFETVTYEGVAIERLVDPQRRVSCHRCWLDDVCVYGNSLAAVRRVIDAHAGRTPRLADAKDFQYMRAVVFPLQAESEDGFLYLSDAFIRRLVGPELRINEKRRLEVITSLKMIANAALYYGFTRGPGQPTLDDLLAAGVLTRDDLFDPGGGTFSWDAQRGIARSSTYGDLSFLTPLIEIDCDRATTKEREQYERFRDRYQQYWRQYFDPIGVRIKVDKTIRVETCILPLIDLSEYGEFQDIAGGEPIAIRPDRFTPSTLLRFIMHLNEGQRKQQALGFLSMMTGTNLASDWVGDWVTFWIEDTDAFTTLVRNALRAGDDETEARPPTREALDVFNASFVAGVHTKNKLSLAAFLVSLRTFIEQTAPNLVVFNNLEPYQGVTIVQIAPDPRGELMRDLLGPDAATQAATAPATAAVSERGPALYYATVGDGFYIATQAGAIRRLIDQMQAQPPVSVGGASAAGPSTLRANVCFYAAPSAAKLVRPVLSSLLEHRARQVSISNMVQVWLLGRAGVLDHTPLDDAAQNYLGYRLMCPDGGTYDYDAATGDAVSSIHGRLSQPLRLEELPKGSPLGDLLDSLDTVLSGLRFTEEGVSTTLEIRRR